MSSLMNLEPWSLKSILIYFLVDCHMYFCFVFTVHHYDNIYLHNFYTTSTLRYSTTYNTISKISVVPSVFKVQTITPTNNAQINSTTGSV
jgi:hypothetical protein